jgi:hypothetical protein
VTVVNIYVSGVVGPAVVNIYMSGEVKPTVVIIGEDDGVVTFGLETGVVGVIQATIPTVT